MGHKYKQQTNVCTCHYNIWFSVPHSSNTEHVISEINEYSGSKFTIFATRGDKANCDGDDTVHTTLHCSMHCTYNTQFPAFSFCGKYNILTVVFFVCHQH